MTLSRRHVIAAGMAGLAGLSHSSLADEAAGFAGLRDPYAAPRDPGLKHFLATQPQLLVPADAPSSAVIAPRIRKAERLIVSGRITDGAVPIPGAALYAYHTDPEGFYDRDCQGCGNHIVISRLHAALRTDAQGRYQFETNRPGPYGGGEAHIHMVLTTPEDGWQFEMTFDDDPVAKAWLNGRKPMPLYATRGNVSIRPIARDANGTRRITQDIVLRPV